MVTTNTTDYYNCSNNTKYSPHNSIHKSEGSEQFVTSSERGQLKEK
jgi:hypothetical protein